MRRDGTTMSLEVPLSRKLIALVATISLIATLGLLGGCSSKVTGNTTDESGNTASMKPLPEPKAKTYTVKKLKIEDIQKGKGRAVRNGDRISVVYTGTLTDGTLFDKNTTTTLFTFTVGSGEVIKGFDKGVLGMKVGGSRKVTIPASLGYGSEGSGKIPGGATIVFTIDLVRFVN